MTVPKIKKVICNPGSKGWRSGEGARLLPMWPEFKSGHICWLSLLLVFSLAPRGFFLGTPVFSSPQKPTFSKSNSTSNQVDEDPLCGCATFKSLFIYLKSTMDQLLQ